MATPQKLTENVQTCPICSELLNRPCSLSCQHTFCHHCLSKYIQTQKETIKARSIPCPMCRLESKVPNPDEPVEFKLGLVIRNLDEDFVKGADLCTLCKEGGETTPAKYWCNECDASMCDDCLKFHRKIPASSHHHVSDVDGEGNPVRTKKRFGCKKHKEELVKVFCKDHKQAICTAYCSTEHRACKEVVAIQDMIPELKADILKWKDHLHSELQRISNIKAETDDLMKSTNDQSMLIKSDCCEGSHRHDQEKGK